MQFVDGGEVVPPARQGSSTDERKAHGADGSQLGGRAGGRGMT